MYKILRELYNLSFLKVEHKVRYVFKVEDNYVINITQSLHCTAYGSLSRSRYNSLTP